MAHSHAKRTTNNLTPATVSHAAASYTEGPSHPSASSSGLRRRRTELSALDCPYLPAMHPAAETVHAASVAWAKAMGLARTPSQLESLRSAQVGHLVARVFPATADLTALGIAVDWTTLFFCLDDHLEDIHGAVLAAAYLGDLLHVFREGRPPRLTDPFSQAFRDLRERMLDLDIPNWVPRFASCVERLFNGFIDEAKYRLTGVVPELAKYRKNRRNTVGLYIVFLLGELTDGIVLPPEVLDHEAVRELERAASNIVGLANDILTVEKELKKGEVNNTVLVLMHEHELTLEEATTRAIELHNEEMHAFARAAASLPKFDAAVEPQLRRYVDVLIAFITGHRDWAHQTNRYRAVGVPIRDDGDEFAR